MADRLLVDFKGQVLAPGTLARVPASFEKLNNLVQPAPGVIRTRTGFTRVVHGAGGIWKMFPHASNGVYVNYGAAAPPPATSFGINTGGNTSGLGLLANAPDRRMMGAYARGNLYLTSDTGLVRVESNNDVFTAGLPRGLGLDLAWPAAVLVNSGGNPLADGYAWSYRVTLCKKDNDGVVMEGPPSGRTVVKNATSTSGYAAATTRSVTGRVLLPKAFGTASTALTTAYFIRVYRSAQAQISVGPPDDEHQLVYEAFLAAGDIAAGYVDVVDSVPDNLRGQYLHTNPVSGDDGVVRGSANSNDGPPLARDVVLWNDCLWLTELAERFTLEVVMLTVPADNDTFTVGARTYTAKVAPAAAPTNEFGIVSGGSATANIEATALNLVARINADTSQTGVWAQYVSGPFDLPGRIRFDGRTFLGFSATASAGAKWRPNLAAGVTATQEGAPNGALPSKKGQFDAFPRVNRYNVGPSGASLLRAVALRDSLFFFTDKGLYRAVGRTFSDFRVLEFDLSFRLAARECVAVCDDAIYAWGFQGVARITERGVEYVHLPIEPLVERVRVNATQATFADYAFAVARQSLHRVEFWYPTGSSEQQCAKALVYDTRLDAWTEAEVATGGPGNFSTGCVGPDDLARFGDCGPTGSGFVYVERRAGTADDFQDVTRAGNDAVIAQQAWLNFQMPAGAKAVHWQELVIEWDVDTVVDTYKQAPTEAVTVGFHGEWGAEVTVTLPAPTGTYVSRILVPREHRRSSRLRVRLGLTQRGVYMGIVALSLMYRPSSHRVVK